MKQISLFPGLPGLNKTELDCPTDQWFTPEWVIKAALELIGREEFDLDPFSPGNNELTNVPAKKYHSLADSGLDSPWSGDLFINPPYSDPALGLAIEKLEHELVNIASAFVVVPCQFGPNWSKFLNQYPFYAPNKRTKFYSPISGSDSPRSEVKIVWITQDQSLADLREFARVFQKYDESGKGQVYVSVQ